MLFGCAQRCVAGGLAVQSDETSFIPATVRSRPSGRGANRQVEGREDRIVRLKQRGRRPRSFRSHRARPGQPNLPRLPHRPAPL